MPPSPTDNRELKSWKEIAGYLGVTVRTAQRYEQELGLPIRRLPGGRGRIWTPAAEIDAWKEVRLQRNGLELAKEPAEPVSSPSDASGRPALFSKTRRSWWVLACVVVVAAATVGLLRPVPVPARARLDHNTLIISDASGRELWRRAFSERLALPANANEDSVNYFWFGDLENDGRREVLFNKFSLRDDQVQHSELLCFSNTGSLKWAFTPGREVWAPVNKNLAPNYHAVMMRVAPLDRKYPNCIVLVSLHDMHFPTQVALLSPGGELLREYWHSGYLLGAGGASGRGAILIADLNKDGRDEIILGGVNNGSQCATLIVLDPEHMGGASVEENPAFQLRGFEPGREIARLMFQRSCLNAGQIRNDIENIRVNSGLLFVDTKEHWDPVRGDLDYGTLNYVLDSGFRVVELRPADTYVRMHNQLHSLGKLDHDYSDRELEPLRNVRVLRPTR